MDNYSDLFSQHEPDLLLRELNGNILWYWKPMSPDDKRMGCVSNAPFEAVSRIKGLRAALLQIAETPDHYTPHMVRTHARAALAGEKTDD